MENNLLEMLKNIGDPENRLNILREYLQCMILKFIEEKAYIKNIAFVGGTALRFLYNTPRFSEDLDFSLVQKEKFDFDTFSRDLPRAFEAWNINVELSAKSVRTVKNLLIKFPALMFESGVSHRMEQKLLIKLELDCNPPEGYHTEMSFNNKYLPLNIFHYDMPSLFAGKLHAVLLRQYSKGRDFYDLMWFLSKKTPPNLTQLENAIYQTTGKKTTMDIKVLKQKLLERISEVDFQKIQHELLRFLANKNDAQYINKDTLKQLIGNFSPSGG